jgi:hypothetical protein
MMRIAVQLCYWFQLCWNDVAASSQGSRCQLQQQKQQQKQQQQQGLRSMYTGTVISVMQV